MEPLGGSSYQDVVHDLTRIVDTCRRDRSALGVFPAMYRTVTTTVGDGIDQGVFDDPRRVEDLVVTFARLYVDAFDGHLAGARVARSWDLAFRFAQSGRGSICQHLMLGMNAHINLDLGIAAAAVCSPEDVDTFRDDFVRVNDVLFALVDELQECVNEVSPWMARLDRLGLGFDELCLRTGIGLARARAWDFAATLVPRGEPERSELIAERDVDTRRLGQLVCHRFSALHMANRAVAWRECRDAATVIDALGRARIDVTTIAARSA